MKRVVVALAMPVLLAVSCSAETPEAGESTASTTPRSPAPKPPAHLGQTLHLMRIGEQAIAVTLDEVINPATVPNGWGDPGKSYVATKLTIKNTGTTTIVGNSKSDVSVVGSDNQSYGADVATVTECRDFVYGWFLLPAGDSLTGCVVFGLSAGVSPTKVKYTPSSGISRDVGEWLNP